MSLFLLTLVARAELPLPTYPECGEIDREDLCPEDLDASWNLISYIPVGSRDSVRPAELEMGSGVSADKAFRYTTGRFDTMLGVCDSGYDWANRNYVNKIALNTGELPLPWGPDGLPAGDYDYDGNGLVNVQDWVDDARVDITAGRDVADGMLDPSDLIYTFSDTVDDDGNGFVDDIAGWDFFANDNDAYHEFLGGYGDHGDGVVEEMAAEGGDGGDLGICPNCSVLLMRTGDGFVTDGHRVASAIAYAAGQDAAVINMSLGGLSRPAELEVVAAWAIDRGVTLVGVAGDENAYHANQPTMLEDFIYVKSIHSDTDDENYGAYSYLNFFNCNNFGPRLDWSVTTSACATGAAALTSGAAGLLISQGKDMGITLTPREVRQLLAMTADDVFLSEEERSEAGTYPSSEGWDFFYGYGRMNIGRATEALAAGKIPPVAGVSSPRWFDTLVPSGTIAIEGFVSADRSSGYEYVVEVATGWEADDWREVGRGSGTSAFEGTLAELDLSEFGASVGEPIRAETILGRVDRVFAPEVTIRITVTDASGNVGQSRKSFFVREDETLVSGFPLSMDESGESSPKLTDLDGDGDHEIVIATGGGRVHAYQHDGTELPGWPVETQQAPIWHDGQRVSDSVSPLRDGFIATVAVGDLEGDGEPEVVAASGGGFVYAWHVDGTPVSGFPVEMTRRAPEEFTLNNAWDNGFAGAPSLYDLDGDGTLEILAAGMDQRVYAWDYSGAPWGPYPLEYCAEDLCGVAGNRMITSVAVGDVDNDGDADLGFGSNEAADGGGKSVSYLVDANSGVLHDGWPILESGLVGEAALLPIVGEGHPSSLAFADIDGNGDLEIASCVMLGTSPIYNHDATVALDLVYVASGYGENHNSGEPSLTTMSNNVAFGDITGDGKPEFFAGGAGTYYLISLPLISALDYQHVAAGWGSDGKQLSGWPRQIEDLQFLVSPAVADVTGDGKAEAIFGSAGYMLYAWDESGELASGWPKFTGNWILGSPAVGDIDGDGYVEVVASTREGNLFAWHTQGHADQAVQWAGIHHDVQNTSNWNTPIPVQAGPQLDECAEGGCCGCDHGNAGLAAGWLGGLALLILRRRTS